MTGSSPGGTDGEDPSYADITALLAGARAAEPVPDEVAARLDATLAELTADRRRTSEAVVPLAGRRRLTGRRLLAAAAAVVVAGGAGIGLSHLPTSGSPSAGSAPRSTEAGAAAGTAPVPGTASSLEATKGLQDLRNGPLAAAATAFRTATFARDAAAYLRHPVVTTQAEVPHAGNALSPAPSPATSPGAGGTTGLSTPVAPGSAAGTGSRAGTTGQDGLGARDYSTRSNPLDSAGGAAAAPCTGPLHPHGATYPITLDGGPAVLVVHPAHAGRRLVQAWSCDGSAVLASARVRR
jgi:hypothetical protein